jgi:hypothetical protein
MLTYEGIIAKSGTQIVVTARREARRILYICINNSITKTYRFKAKGLRRHIDGMFHQRYRPEGL